METKNNFDLSDILGEVPNWAIEIGKHAKSHIDSNKSLKSIQKIMDYLAEGARLVTEMFKRLPDDLVQLAKHGWFLELEEAIEQSKELSLMLSEGRVAEVDNRLVAFYSGSLDRIIDELCKRHKGRKKHFEQYKEAHLAGMYFASVPLILSQVDGVCKDVTKQAFFMKDKNSDYKSKAVVELENRLDQTSELLLAPLKQQTPILAHESKLSEFPCNLNRHRVMHGNSLDYGTELNSLKSLSLLKYISDVLEETEWKL